MAAIFSPKKLKASPKALARTRIVRTLLHHFKWTGTMLHLFWGPTRVMPADPVSRIRQVFGDFLGKAIVEAVNKLNTIMKDLQLIHLVGSGRV